MFIDILIPVVGIVMLIVVETMIDKKEKKLAVNWDDELVKGTVLTRDGAIVHPNFQAKTA